MRARARVLALGLLLALGAAAPAGAQTDEGLSREEAVELGREAYRYGIPLLEFLRVRRENTSVRAPVGTNAPVNTFGNATRLATPRDRTIVAPNNDTLYSIAHLDLGREPVVLSHPGMGRRYFSFQFLDPYTNTFGYVGTRTTGSRAGRFALRWRGRRARGIRTISSPSRRVWVIGRTLVRDERDIPRARALMRRYGLTPLSRLGEPTRRSRRAPGRPRKFPVPEDGVRFLEALGRALRENPPPARDGRVLRRLGQVGIGPGRSPERAGVPDEVLDGVRAGVEAEARELPARARAGVLGSALAAGGWYQPDPRIGNYGTAYELRALVAIVGLGANTPEEATYPVALADSGRQLFDGDRRYRIVFRRGQLPPVRAFWSLTMYDLDGFLVPNRARRYAVGDTHPPLLRRPDGSVVVVIGRTRPRERGVNWLPSPAGAFRLNLRLYLPTPRALGGAWRPPPVRPVAP